MMPSEVGTVEVLDECYVIEACVDRYLFALYQRAPKEDTVAVEDKRQVTIKRKGKTVTVTRTFTRRADQDFAWKDPKAAEKAGMTMPQYVIGGMDRDFKMKLFRMLLAAEQAGQYPGITSAFRDDYRQSIASGLKAASDRSYHGGSFRGGYGHGLAADIVSINGATRAQRLASTQAFWKWVDAHGKDYGVGRPYLDHDPPHVGPTDGKEYADKHPAPHAGRKLPLQAGPPRGQARPDGDEIVTGAFALRWLSALGIAALLAASPASAADIRVMISAGFHGVYSELAPVFERASGHHLITTRGPSMGDFSGIDSVAAFAWRGGRRRDPRWRAADELGKRGLVRPDSKTELARSEIGMVVQGRRR